MREIQLNGIELHGDVIRADLRPEDARLLKDLANKAKRNPFEIKLLVVPWPAERKEVADEELPGWRRLNMREQAELQEAMENDDTPRIFGTSMADSLAGPHQTKAMHIVRQYIMSQLDKTDKVTPFDIYVVWFCFILGGWKALISTDIQDGMYYEVTHDHHEKCTYLDAYKKFYNVRIPD